MKRARRLVELLREKGLKISAAESCTGGLFSKKITDIPGSSDVIDVSIVTYANDAKIKFLGVDPEIVEMYGVVTESVAKQMARGAANLMGADIGVGITGIAGPGGGSRDKPVGLVCTSIYFNGMDFPCEMNFSGSREEIREKTANAMLENVVWLIERECVD